MVRDALRRTRIVISRGDRKYFDDSRGCLLENFDGRSGYLTLVDALVNDFVIRDKKTGKVVNVYTSLERLIEGGWRTQER